MITLSHVEHNYNLEPVLADFSMVVNPGERVGLIGANGSGKSTVFKLIAGLEMPKKGVVAIGRNVRIGYLRQIPERKPGETVEMRLYQGNVKLLEVERRMREVEEHMEQRYSKAEMNYYIAEYGKLTAEFEHAGGYTYESKKKQIVQGLGFTVPLTSETATLSGGELARLELAVLLLTEPEILLLDEPTNHLDFSAISWLEGFLAQYTGTVLVVSHDRYFLDKTIKRVVEVKNGKAEEYPGNYSYYLTERERRFELAMKEYENQQKEIKKKEEAIKRLRQWGVMSDNPKFFRRAVAMEKQLERMERVDRPNMADAQFQLKFGAERSGKEVLSLKGVRKAFNERTLFKGIDLQVFYGQRIGLLGPNGTGKTTLLKMILGQLTPDEGQIKIGSNVQIGYFDQHQELLNMEAKLLEVFKETAPAMSDSRARSILANYGFPGDEVFKQVKELSGGERSRLILLKMVFTQVNFLILDEPTNHLDLPSVEILEETLQDYDGTLLLISHDRYFLNKVVEKIYAIEDGLLIHYQGNFDYYQMKIKERNEKPLIVREKNIKVENSRPLSNSEKEERKNFEKLNLEINRLEEEITSLEKVVTESYKLMTQPEYLNNYLRLTELKETVENFETKLQEKLTRWEFLVEKREK